MLNACFRLYLELDEWFILNNDSKPQTLHRQRMQLCEGATPEEARRWTLADARSFHYLNQSSCFELKGVDNAVEYKVGFCDGFWPSEYRILT